MYLVKRYFVYTFGKYGLELSEDFHNDYGYKTKEEIYKDIHRRKLYSQYFILESVKLSEFPDESQ